MDRELVQDYLIKTGMNGVQAEALSRIFAEMATKSDMRALEQRLDAKMSALEQKFDWLRAEVDLKFEKQSLSFDQKLEALKSELTWRSIGAIALFATVMTIVDLFID